MRVLACQPDIVWEDKPANFAKVRELVDAAAPGPGSLVVLPEMFATGFSMDAEKIGEEASGETVRFLRQLASDHECAVIGGVASACLCGGRQANEGRSGFSGFSGFCNEALAVSPSGEEIARYRKIHLFTPGGEHEHYAPGEAPVVFEFGGFRVAVFICYDLRFPEEFRAAVRRSADLFIVIANWPAVRLDHWVTLLRARAIENQACVAGVNRTGSDPSHEYPGRSMIIGPAGEVLAEAGAGECVVSAEIDPAVVERVRRDFPALRDMRSS